MRDLQELERETNSHMTFRLTLVFVTMFALLTNPFVLLGQQTGDWAAVKAIGSGQEIRVETRSGKKIDGDLESVSDDKIVVKVKGTSEEVSSSEVKKVYRVGNGSRGPGVGIGAAIGAGAGAAIGVASIASTGGSDDTASVITPFILIGAGVGALAGAFIRKKKRTLIYEAR